MTILVEGGFVGFSSTRTIFEGVSVGVACDVSPIACCDKYTQV